MASGVQGFGSGAVVGCGVVVTVVVVLVVVVVVGVVVVVVGVDVVLSGVVSRVVDACVMLTGAPAGWHSSSRGLYTCPSGHSTT